MSSANNGGQCEKFPIGKNANINLTHCNCRNDDCDQLYYHAGWKRHIVKVNANSFLQLKKYDFDKKKKN